MKKILASTLTIALVISTIAGVLSINLVSANPYGILHLPTVKISSTGAISSNCDFISRNGNIYTLTGNVTNFSIEIDCSDIVFDGAGHTIDVRKDDRIENGYLLRHKDDGLLLANVHNVIVRNVTVFASNYRDIHLYGTSNCTIENAVIGNIHVAGNSNTITESNTGISIFSGNGNVITRNNVTYLSVWEGCYSNTFSKNNFILAEYPDIRSNCLWDDSSTGNYWNNYTTKYLNASELGNSGIGDTPYQIERSYRSVYEVPDLQCVDSHPLMYPWGAPDVVVFGEENATYLEGYPLVFTVNKPVQRMSYSLDGGTNVTLAGNFTLNGLAPGVHNLTVYAQDNSGFDGASKTVFFTVVEPFPTALVTGICATSVVGVAACLFYGKKKCSQR